ncbi:MAG: hypothetical protein NC115_08115 [Bacteroidales bacterium]|nr:hypothetical protein [Bacteroides sp.]MCM1197611.1 hypothetical protein [Clostridium sp.]MCM1502610.1 hypothetical protein [Bacteroidales bacterium]
MKHKFLVAAGAALVAAAVSVFVYVKNASSPMDEFFNANVEALAGGEGGGAAGCTGPKKENIAGNIFCHCENTAPCHDMYGC